MSSSSNFFGVQKTPATDTRDAYIGKFASDTANNNTSNIFLDDFRLFNNALDTQKSQLVYYGQTLISGLAPTNLRITDISSTTARIQYTANPKAASYEIRTVPETSTFTTTDISCVITGLSQYVPYTIYVFGVQADGKKGTAAKVSVLEPPENLVANVSMNNASVGLQYSAAFGATTYRIETTPATSTVTTSSLTPTLTGFSNTDISYTVAVYARDTAQGLSQSVSRTIGGKPEYVVITDITNTTLSLIYAPTAGAAYYEIDTVPATTTIQTTMTNVDISGLTAGTTYTVYIRSVDSNGTRSFNASIGITMPRETLYYYKFDASDNVVNATPVAGINTDAYIISGQPYDASAVSVAATPSVGFTNAYSPATNKIYMFPASTSSSDISIFDVSTNTISTISGGTSRRYRWATYAPSNGKIYVRQYTGVNGLSTPSVILVFNPVNYSSTTISLGTNSGSFAWENGVYVDHNQTIVYIPRSQTQILVINTLNDTASYYSTSLSLSSNAFIGCAYSPATKKVYGIPFQSGYVCTFDTVTNAIDLSAIVHSRGATQMSWHYGILGPNGKIYGFNWNATNMLVIDPVANTATQPSGLNVGSQKFFSGVVSPLDNKIYCSPYNPLGTDTNIYVINPATDTYTTIPFSSTGMNFVDGTVIANNYNIYSISDAGGSSDFTTKGGPIMSLKSSAIVYSTNASSFSTADSANPYKAFDASNGTSWISASNIYDVSGNYTGSAATAIQSVGTISGEWLQMKLPYSVKMTQYTISSRTAFANEMPRVFYILGSNDGTTWFPIDYQVVVGSAITNAGSPATDVPPTGAIFTKSRVADTAFYVKSFPASYYTYFRIVVRNVYATRGAAGIAEWNIRGEINTVSNYGQNGFVATKMDSTLLYSGNSAPQIQTLEYKRGNGAVELVSQNKNSLSLSNTTFGTNEFSVSTWIKPTAVATNLGSTNYFPTTSLGQNLGSASNVNQLTLKNAVLHADWETRTPSPSDRNWSSVCWSKELGLFVAVANSGDTSGNRVATTPDGINWTARATPADNSWNSICWSPELELFAAVSNLSARNFSATPAIGINANTFTNANGTYIASASSFLAFEFPYKAFDASIEDNSKWYCNYDDFNNLWTPYDVNGNYTGGNNTFYTTVIDGTTISGEWIQMQFPFSFALSSYTIYSSDIPKEFYIAGSNNGTTWSLVDYTVIPNTTTFTKSISNTSFYNYYRMVIFKSHTQICEIARWDMISNTKTIMTSPNATTWTLRDAPNNSSWSSVAWSPELSIFAAVGTSSSSLLFNRATNSYAAAGSAYNDISFGTVETWIRSNGSLTGEHSIIGVRYKYYVYLINGILAVYDYGAATYRISSINLTNNFDWHHIAFVFQSGVNNGSKLYYDGIPVLTLTMTVSSNTPNEFTVGGLVSASNSYAFNGYIDEPRVWRTLRSDAEIFANYNIQIPSNSTGLVGYWLLNEGTGTTSVNQVSGGSPLTLYQSTTWSIDQPIMTSPDGLTWTSRTAPSTLSWNSICWSPERRIFVAVSNPDLNPVMTSHNGIHWVARSAPSDKHWMSVCWSPQRGLFVAVASSGVGNRVMTSPDGITWTQRPTPADNNWTSVTWSAEAGLFTAVASSGTGNRVMTSPDGFTWTLRISPVDNSWNSVVWSPELEMFCAVATTGTAERVMTNAAKQSTIVRNTTTTNTTTQTSYLLAINDGSKAKMAEIEVNLSGGIVYAYEKNAKTSNSAIALTPASINTAYASGSSATTGKDGYGLLGVNYYITRGSLATPTQQTDASFLETTTPGRVIGTTTDARQLNLQSGVVVADWVNRTVPTAAQTVGWRAVAWSPELGIFAAVGQSSTTMSSIDGITWSAKTSSVPNLNWHSVCWSPQLGIFAAVALDGTGNQAMTSSNGIDWTTRQTNATTSSMWAGICWSPELGIFVAVSYTNTRIMTSSNGITWNEITGIGSNAYESVAWSPELRIFVAVGNGKYMTSTNGTNWTETARTGIWLNVVWSPELRLFVAVGVNIIMTSTNGTDWVSRTSPANVNWRGIAWAPEIGLFVSVSQNTNSSANTAMSSHDGINWRLMSIQSTVEWFRIAWSPSLRLFAAVAYSQQSSGTTRAATLAAKQATIVPYTATPATSTVADYLLAIQDASSTKFALLETTLSSGILYAYHKESKYVNSTITMDSATINSTYTTATATTTVSTYDIINLRYTFTETRRPLLQMTGPTTDSSTYSTVDVSGTTSKYWGAVSVPQYNRVYFIPSMNTNVIAYDISTNTSVANISVASGSSKWSSGILAPNGKIYCVPTDSSSVLIIDPSTNTVDSTTITGIAGSNKFIGGALAPNGKIYCPPFGANYVLVIDTSTNTTSQIAVSGQNGWSGAVLANNGKIYGVPYGATSVLIIDPTTNTVDTSTLPLTNTHASMYGGGALSYTGKIYCVPYDASNVLIIDPIANTTNRTTLILADSTLGKYRSVVAAPNGRLYGIPYNATNILVIDPFSNTFTTSLNTGLSGLNKFGDAAVGSNGRIYAAPIDASTVHIITPYMKSVSIDISNGFPRFSRYTHSSASTNTNIEYTAPVSIAENGLTDSWTHLGVSADASGVWTVYVNGLPYSTGLNDVFMDTGINNRLTYTQNNLSVGRYLEDVSAANTLSAYLDDFRVSGYTMDFSYASLFYNGSSFLSRNLSPSNLSVVDISNTSIRVSITPNTAASTYRVRLTPEAISPITISNVASNEIVVSGISPSPLLNTYNVYVYGANSAGLLSYPSFLPQNLSPTSLGILDIGTSSIKFSLDPNLSASTYQVRLSPSGGVIPITVSNPSTREVTITGISPSPRTNIYNVFVSGANSSSALAYPVYLKSEYLSYKTVADISFAGSMRVFVYGYSGPVVKVRRSTDNVESDFYTDARQTYLTTGAGGTGTFYATWIGDASGYITRWYNQNGSSNHANNTANNATQPNLVLRNGKYVIQCRTNDDTQLILDTPINSNTVFSQFWNDNTIQGAIAAQSNSSGTRVDLSVRFGNPATSINGSMNGNDWFFSSVAPKLNYVNGVSTTTLESTSSWKSVALAVTTPTSIDQSVGFKFIGRGPSNLRGINGYMTEFILYNKYISNTAVFVDFHNNRLVTDAS